MSWFPDLGNATMVATGDHVRAIGWLSAGHPFSKGAVPVEFVSRLHAFVRLANDSASTLCFPAFGGPHTCELCEKSNDSRNFGVPDGLVLYVSPGMVAHYVEQHGYAPPSAFVTAVMASPLPDTNEYKTLSEPFRQLHKQAQARLIHLRIADAGRWAVSQGGSEEAVREASSRFFGHSLPEMCERIRIAMPNTERSGPA
jgi:hypothetical protein